MATFMCKPLYGVRWSGRTKKAAKRRKRYTSRRYRRYPYRKGHRSHKRSR